MQTLRLPRVPTEEAAPFYEAFLSAFPDGEVGTHLHAQASELETLCAGLTESGSLFRYFIILGHTAHHFEILRTRYHLPAADGREHGGTSR